MASIQAMGFTVPSHPVLYGTTLVISLAGSIAALGSSGMASSVAQIAETLGPAGQGTPSDIVATPAAAETPATVNTPAPAMQASPDFVAAEANAAVTAGRGSIMATVVGAPVQHVARLEATDTVPPAAVQPEPRIAPPEAPAEAMAAAPEPQHDHAPSVESAKPAAAGVPDASFAEAFQAVPEPSLAPQSQPVAVPPAPVASPAPAASVAMVIDQQVPNQVGEAAAALVQPAVAAPVASPAAAPTAAPAPESAAPALVVQPEPAVQPALAAAPPSAPPPAAAAVAPAAAPAPAPTPAAQPLQLVSSPQLRKFDLARIHVLPPAPPASLAPARGKADRLGKAGQAGARDKLVDGTVFHRVTVTVAGSPARMLELRIGADMKPSIKVGDLLGLVSDRMDPASVARFESAASAQDYVSLADLRAAGFKITYNAGTDSIGISAGD